MLAFVTLEGTSLHNCSFYENIVDNRDPSTCNENYLFIATIVDGVEQLTSLTSMSVSVDWLQQMLSLMLNLEIKFELINANYTFEKIM